jgi:hypothetical protein
MTLNRNSTPPRCGLILLAAALSLSCVPQAWSIDVFWTGAVNNNWNTNPDVTDLNWSGNGGFVPVADPYEEVAVINNGGTAIISGAVPDAAGLVLGQAVGDSGTLQIVSGGSVNFVDSNGTPTGAANIGLDGSATLDVRGGGSMTTTLLDVNSLGNVIIGQGAGVASVTSSGGMFLDGVTTVSGPGHTFSATGTVTFEANSRFNADIRAATHSPLSVAGSAIVTGVFKPTFNGASPTAGGRWTLIDATSINGGFTEIDTSALPALPSGQVYRTLQRAGGTNGTLLQFGVDQMLTLRVNWDTKAVSIVNTGPAAVTIDSYSVLSALGGLNSGTWNSLDDQNIGGANVWQEAGPTANALSELSPTGMLTINGNETRTLGTPFAPVIPAEFGVSPEDLVFEYATPTGELFTGLMEYTGTRDTNNFRLTVDPATGQGQIRNESGVSIAIDGYSVQSASGALLTGWNSLDDQNVGGANIWQEANPTADFISELNPSGSTSILPNGGFALGAVWATSGARDLEFVYQLANESTTRTGPVIYGTLPPLSTGGLAGDYNADGKVDAADYTVWRDNLGAPTEAAINNNGDGGGISPSDYAYWKARFGTMAGSGGGSLGAAAVPEPATLCLLLFGLSVIGFQRAR